MTCHSALSEGLTVTTALQLSLFLICMKRCHICFSRFLSCLDSEIQKLAEIEKDLQQACRVREDEKVLITMASFLCICAKADADSLSYRVSIDIPCLDKPAFQHYRRLSASHWRPAGRAKSMFMNMQNCLQVCWHSVCKSDVWESRKPGRLQNGRLQIWSWRWK